MVGERGIGEVAFIDTVDLLGLDLDSVVRFTRGRVQLHGNADGPRLPPPGRGLNVPALVTLRCICLEPRNFCTVEEQQTPSGNVTQACALPRQLKPRSGSARDLSALHDKLEAAAASLGGRFVHYDPATGAWIVKVSGF